MINLIPPEKHRELHAARQNNLLVRYVFAVIVTLFIVIAIHVGTFVLLKTTEINGKRASAENQQKVSKHKETEDAAKEYASNLSTAKELFSKRIPYTDAVINLASQLPAGVILETVSLDAEIINKPNTLTAKTKSYEAALALKDMFNQSTIAKDVSITSVTTAQDSASSMGQGAASSASADYPVSVSMNITFTEELLRPKGSQS